MKEEGRIEICLTPSTYTPSRNVRKAMNFDAYWFKEAMCPIDIPTNADSAMIGRMNMSMKRQDEILERRRDIAKMLSKSISDTILDYFEQQDTIDGYSKKEFRNENY